MNPESNFFDFAVTDGALLHALLSMVGIHYRLMHPEHVETSGLGDTIQSDIIHHQTEAVKDINARLKTYGAHFNDGLVIAVSLLSNCEVSSL